MLDYTIPIADSTQTMTSDIVTTVSETALETTIMTATSTTTTYSTTYTDMKRDIAAASTTSALTTPTALAGYSDDFVSSGCAAAVASPTSTSTAYFTTSYTSIATETVFETSFTTTTAVIATATVGIIQDPSFELNDSSWITSHATIIPYAGAYDGLNVMELSIAKSYYAYALQYLSLDTSENYILTFEVMPVALPSSCRIEIQTNNGAIFVVAPTSSNTWVQYSVALPGDASNIEPYVYCTSVSSVTVYFDAFKIALVE